MVDALARRPAAVVVRANWCGLAGTDVVRRALNCLPNLHCDLAWYRKEQENQPHRLLDEAGRITPDRRKLIEDFPNRFLAVFDNSAEPDQLPRYNGWVRLLRTALGSIRPRWRVGWRRKTSTAPPKNVA